jgi:hypothetical protein
VTETMSDRAATILASAIGLLAVSYFLTNLHRAVANAGGGVYVYNTVTGDNAHPPH